eukprot:SAG31_NODE_12431_length_942_cov_3.374852_1_plen_72_part_01
MHRERVLSIDLNLVLVRLPASNTYRRAPQRIPYAEPVPVHVLNLVASAWSDVIGRAGDINQLKSFFKIESLP